MQLHMFRYALRRLRRTPGYAALVVGALGVALGASACLFCVLYGLLYKPLPFADGERLAVVDARILGMPSNTGVSPPYLSELARSARTLENVAAYREERIPLADEQGSVRESLDATQIQPAAFALLGARALAGRLPGADDARRGAEPVAVLSAAFARSRFGSATAALDARLRLDGSERRVIGVLDDAFAFPSHATSVWLPLVFSEADLAHENAGTFNGTIAIARLAPGASFAAASEEIRAIGLGMPDLRDAFEITHLDVRARALRTIWLGDRAGGLELMLLAVALVFAVALANVCNLALARRFAREREAAVLEALGAGPGRRLRLALAEALLLAAGAAATGLALLPAVLALLTHFQFVPDDTPQRIGIDAASVCAAFALAGAAASALAACALGGGGRPGEALKRSGARQSPSRRAQRVRALLIVVQIAVTSALLLGVGLLLRSSQRLLAEDIGFEREHLVYGLLDADALKDAAARSAVLDALRERIHAIPGIRAVTIATAAPFGDNVNIGSFAPFDWDAGQPRPNAIQAIVDTEYFAALGAPLRHGRAFTREDMRSVPDVVIVDERLAHQYFGERDPLGQRLIVGDAGTPSAQTLTVIGVAPAMKRSALDEAGDRVALYLPGRSAGTAPQSPVLLVRTGVAPETLRAPIAAAVHDLLPASGATLLATMNERIAGTLSDRARINALLELFGAFALSLAVVGLYAVLAYGVRLRHAEFGVRMALGANSRRLARQVLGEGFVLVGGGCLLGLPLAYAIARLLADRLYHVGAFDLTALSGVCALLTGVGLVACWLPARRAAAIQPIQALRSD